MNETDLLRRTKRFGLRVLQLIESLPNSYGGRAVSGQLVRSGTAMGANYRAACRGRSKREFIAKIGVVEEEADESAYWMEIIVEAGMLNPALVQPLLQEAEELRKIMAKSRLTASARS